MSNIRKIAILLTFLLAAAATDAGAQHYIGVRAGYGVGHGRLESGYRPPLTNEWVWGMYSGGIAWKYYSPEKFLGGVSMEIEFLQKAYQYRLRDSYSLELTDMSYRRTVNSVQIPLIWQPHYTTPNNRFRVFLNLGISVQYHFPVSLAEYVYKGKEVYYREKYEQILIRDNPFGYGLLGGLGFNIAFNRWEFMLEGRYYFGYGDILRNNGKYPSSIDGTGRKIENPRRSPLDNITLSTGFFYRLTDGAENPEPGKRALRRQEERRRKQMEQRMREQLHESQIQQATEEEQETPVMVIPPADIDMKMVEAAIESAKALQEETLQEEELSQEQEKEENE